MQLSERLSALEQRTTPERHGIVVVQKWETKADAYKRSGITAERLKKGVLLVPAKEHDHAHS